MSEHHIVLEVFGGGKGILLEDGSRWEIEPEDVAQVRKWSSTSALDIRLVDETSYYSHGLSTRAAGGVVRGRRAN